MILDGLQASILQQTHPDVQEGLPEWRTAVLLPVIVVKFPLLEVIHYFSSSISAPLLHFSRPPQRVADVRGTELLIDDGDVIWQPKCQLRLGISLHQDSRQTLVWTWWAPQVGQYY